MAICISLPTFSMKKSMNNLTSFAAHLDEQYGKSGTDTRKKYEQEFEAFKLDLSIRKFRKTKFYNRSY